MRNFLIVIALLAASACSEQTTQSAAGAEPPANAEPTPSTTLVAAAEPAAAEPASTGPYTNSWDSDRFSTFRHTLTADSGGVHTLTLRAETNAGGGETVAVYKAGPDGERRTGWRLFVVASRQGESDALELEFPQPEGGVSRVPVVVAVENAGGRRHAGSYTLTVE